MFVYPFCFPHSAGFNPRTHTGCGHVHLLHVASIFCFNPRTTQGATFWVVPCIVIMLVSIHAPTQGATCTGTRQSMWAMCFNPRTHTGCDVSRGLFGGSQIRFNPRTHTGCDDAEPDYFAYMEVSIHAPTRGATERSFAIFSAVKVSIHAPTRGATAYNIEYE